MGVAYAVRRGHRPDRRIGWAPVKQPLDLPALDAGRHVRIRPR
jgi:hypothetical protein